MGADYNDEADDVYNQICEEQGIAVANSDLGQANAATGVVGGPQAASAAAI